MVDTYSRSLSPVRRRPVLAAQSPPGGSSSPHISAGRDTSQPWLLRRKSSVPLPSASSPSAAAAPRSSPGRPEARTSPGRSGRRRSPRRSPSAPEQGRGGGGRSGSSRRSPQRDDHAGGGGEGGAPRRSSRGRRGGGGGGGGGGGRRAATGNGGEPVVRRYGPASGVDVKDVDRVIIWGNHSATQYPDVSHARIGGKWAKDVIKDEKWLTGDFVSRVQKRGAEVIAARGASSAASAASAAIDNIRDVHLGSDKWQSIGVLSDGSYGIGGGLWYSVPCACEGLHYTRVKGLPVDEYSAKMMNATEAELVAERDAVRHLLPSSYDSGVPLQKLVDLKDAWMANDKARVQEASKSLPARFQAAVKNALSS